MKKIDFSLFSKLFQFTKPYRPLFWFVSVVGILVSLLAVARPYFLKITVDNYIVPKDYEGLVKISLLIVSLLTAEVISQMAFAYYTSWIGQTVIRDIRKKLFNHLLRFRMNYYNKSSVGVLVTRAVSDMERIAEIFSSGLFEILSDVLKMIVVIIVMLVVDWQLALVVFIMMPLLLYITRWFQKSMKKAFAEVRKEVSNLNSFVQERLSGMRIVQLFVREQSEFEKFKEINQKHKNAWLKTVWYNSIFFPLAELVTSVAIGLIVWYGGLRAIDNNSVNLGSIFMFIQLTQMLFRPLRQIADKFNTLQMGMIAAERVFAILDIKETAELESGKEFMSVREKIAFTNVHFSYIKGEEILKGISFEVKKGETIAIVGATGAGKSTIISLLNRFYDVDKGNITIDGTDIRDFSLQSLRSRIAVVLQDVFLFADSILNNITLQNPSVTEEKVVQAAKKIGIHDFLMQLPNGYHYNVRERGSMLSSGQRQLISFLRAYVVQPDILILDEATSSVDSQSEKLIQEATEKITENRTSIIIAHRLATIRKADRIIVLDRGQIVEQGNHSSLLEIENGFYRNLYEVQFKGQ